MPLIISGTLFEDRQKALDHVFNNEVFKESSAKFRQEPVQTVPSKNFLYVHQRELAVISPNDEYIKVMGTDDATTCHMIVIRHTGSGVTSLAHCDGCDTERAITEMVDTVTEMSKGGPPGRLEVHIVGGFIDDRQESIKLSNSLIDMLTSCSEEVHLQTACITNLNDEIINDVHFPAIYGIGVHVETGHIFPATFQRRGPEMDVRSASHFVGCHKMLNIYESGKGVLKVGPYSWEPWEDAAKWITFPDRFIRKYMSTSPAQEPEHFAQNVRAALKVLCQHPQPHHTLFSDGQPHRYLLQPDGRWEPLDTTTNVH